MVENTAMARPAAATLDSDTFTGLYESYTYAVFNYCLFRVNDRAAAEDLTADTFERAWRARHRYQADRAAFSTWLFTIARRVVTDWQRRRARRSWFRLWEQQPGGEPSLESQFEESEEQQRLRQLVLALEQPEQELIALKFGAGLTNRDIGPVVGKSETAVGTAIYRIMQKLRAQWKNS